MKTINESLEEINQFLKDNKIEGTLTYRSEVSHLVRCGRSQIALNVSEEGEKIFIDLQENKKKISSSLTFSLDKIEEIKGHILDLHKKIEFMPEIEHLTPLKEIHLDRSNKHVADERITNINSMTMINLFKAIDSEFENDEVEISGAFSSGDYSYSIINTLVDHCLSYKGSDFNVEVVLQLLKHDKKEIRSASVGENLDQYNEEEIVKELRTLYDIKTTTKREDVDPGSYDVIFSAHAFADLTNYMGYLTYHGEAYQYQMSMLSKETQSVGSKIFGENVTIIDDPSDSDILFGRPVGMNGVSRPIFPLIQNGVLRNMFYSDKDTCDRFSLEVNNDANVSSIKVESGDGPSSFDEMVKSCEKPTIYIPYIHYMNFTNPAKGEFTGTSRFGTFLINEGEIQSHLWNVRLNDSYMDLFNNIEWLSSVQAHINTSNTYEMRMASSITCPKFVKVNGVKISGSSAPGRG